MKRLSIGIWILLATFWNEHCQQQELAGQFFLSDLGALVEKKS